MITAIVLCLLVAAGVLWWVLSDGRLLAKAKAYVAEPSPYDPQPIIQPKTDLPPWEDPLPVPTHEDASFWAIRSWVNATPLPLDYKLTFERWSDLPEVNKARVAKGERPFVNRGAGRISDHDEE